jgi:hypothetical protein
MLPTIKALRQQGHRIALHVQTDFPTVDLWRRCSYADEVHEAHWPAENPIAGQWMPAAWGGHNVQRVQIGHPYRMSEAESNLRLAGGAMPNVSDWCKDLDRTPRYDIGIVPGSKGGIWLRKRYPGMAAVSSYFASHGARVAVIGQDSDGVREMPGARVINANIGDLPDILAGCRVIIGTDSGVTHLASSLGVPVVAVFTATSTIKGKPVGPHNIITTDLPCRPCQSTTQWQACREWKCRDIEPERVIRAAEQLLEKAVKE